MESINLSFGDEPVSVMLTDTFTDQILANAKYFKCENMCTTLLLMDDIYDVASWYTHSDGKKYGVIHTVSGSGDPAMMFAEQLRVSEWQACASEFKHKKEQIKYYLVEAGCDVSKVYCLFEI